MNVLTLAVARLVIFFMMPLFSKRKKIEPGANPMKYKIGEFTCVMQLSPTSKNN